MEMNFPHEHGPAADVAKTDVAASPLDAHKKLIARAIARQASSRSVQILKAVREYQSEISTSPLEDRMVFFAGELKGNGARPASKRRFKRGSFRPDLLFGGSEKSIE